MWQADETAIVEADATAIESEDEIDGHLVLSDIHGSMWKVLVEEGQVVEAGASVVILEAMKTELTISVVGAHLSGMPLNHELTGRHARFLRAAQTTPDYKLFALAGGPPRRPGLMRVADGTGKAIATEVWAISPESLGSRVRRVASLYGEPESDCVICAFHQLLVKTQAS